MYKINLQYSNKFQITSTLIIYKLKQPPIYIARVAGNLKKKY